jgi:predicted transcriptional regulator
MTDESQHETLLEFFKALADGNRLKIVGFLAQRPYTVEELAQALGLGVSTTSHHLSYLSHVGLVSARASGHYAIYSLEMNALQEKARHLLQADNLTRLSKPAEAEGELYDRKVLSAFVNAQGQITSFPAQEKKYLVILRYVAQAFDPGVRYSEKQVNEILLRFNKDTASLRRGMIEHHLMEREGGGGQYWRPMDGGKSAQDDLQEK